MKKTIYIILAVAIIGIVAVYFVRDKQTGMADTSQAQSTVQQSNSQQTTVQPTMQATTLKDGTFSGDVDTNQFGNVEVSITVSGGKISSVNLIQIPDEDPRSKQISEFATQQLVEATITNQTSDLDTISGATYTSLGYINSLKSAIDKSRS